MAASTQDALESIERRRAQLQESVDKLQKALTHWTTWEAEYQMLKEELESSNALTPTQIRETARDLDLTLVNEKEVEELLGKALQTKRSTNQVVDMISRRIDYVQQNSATIEKQLDAAEKQLAGVDILLDPGVDNEEGLPMMDIEEELDEDGNEVSSHINQTGKSAAEVVEVLRKAGLQKAELDKKSAEQVNGKDLQATAKSVPAKPRSEDAQSTSEPSVSASRVKPQVADVSPAKKTVSFADDVQTAPVKKKAQQLQTDRYNEDLESLNLKRSTKVIELDEDGNEIATYPIIPQDESPEDAELRRQMLQYGLSEVGQIVAELDLDNPVAQFSDDETDDGFDDDYVTEDEEDEDQYGRTAKPVLTEDYRKQMLELEKKLNARMLENVGPESNLHPLAEHVDDVRTLRVRRDDEFDESLATTKTKSSESEASKKGVRFADDIDISKPPPPAQAPAEASPPVVQFTSTISDTIFERPATVPQAPTAPTKPTKVSRFKSARSGSNQPQMLPAIPVPEPSPVPSGPAGRTLADSVTEHTASALEPDAPDEFDPVMIGRQIQADYHKARNKFIHQQGGFKPSQEDVENPLLEEKNGKTKKVSRFMAARLKADGM